MKLERTPSGLLVECHDATVGMVTLTSQLTFTAEAAEPGETLSVTIKSDCLVVDGSTAWDPLAPEDDDPRVGALILLLRGQQLTRVVMTNDARLDATFESGLTISVPRDPEGYEPWEVGHRDFRVIGLADGDLAIWDFSDGG